MLKHLFYKSGSGNISAWCDLCWNSLSQDPYLVFVKDFFRFSENHGVFVECVANVMMSRSDYISVNL